MKHILSAVLVMTLLTACGSLTATAGETATVSVTISDNTGALVLVQQPVTVTDKDGDGILTVNDALVAAHEAKFPGGATGYASEPSDYGISLVKLWGVDNGGSYGYYLNNAMCMGLTDAVKTGDRLQAYCFTDLTAFSDTYCYFDFATATMKEGESLTLTLSAAGFDANWNPVVLPVAGAMITVDGRETGVTTDAAGHATLTLDTAGTVLVSARSATATLVPPVGTVMVGSPVITTTTTTTATATSATTATTASAQTTGESQPVEPLLVAVTAGLLVWALCRRKADET